MKRFTRENVCPVCGGFDGAPRGQGIRCFGFLSEDGKWCRCTREEHAGSAPYDEKSKGWVHGLDGPCKCGRSHDDGAAPARARSDGPRPRIVAAYDYRNERGELVFQVCRMVPKSFRQRRPDGTGGWKWNLDGVTEVVDLHSLRVSFASLLAENNVAPKIAQQLMQHSSVELTLGLYAKVRKGADRAAVDGLRIVARGKEGTKQSQSAADAM